MSDSKVMSSEAVDPQKQLDGKFSLILEKLREHDSHLDFLRRLDNTCDLIIGSHKRVEDRHYQEIQKAKQSLADLDDKQAHLQKQNSALSLKISEMGDIHKSLWEEIEILRNNYSIITKRLLDLYAELTTNYQSKKSFEEHKNQNDSLLLKMQAQFGDLKGSIGQLGIAYGHLESLLKNQASDHKDLKKALADHQTSMESKLFNLNLSHSVNVADAIAKLDKFQEQMKDELKAVRCDSKQNSSSLENSKQDISKKLENALIDASNAVSRSSNCEQQLKLMEKKIESLNLQIKKYELAK